jgi:hypothetical protein
VTFLGNAPVDGGTVFALNANLTVIKVSSLTTGWVAKFSGVNVVDENNNPIVVPSPSPSQSSASPSPSPSQSSASPSPSPQASKAAYVSGSKITGKPKVGQTVTVKPGIWSGTAPITYKYQWYLCKSANKKVSIVGKVAPKCVVIKKATKAAFKITAKQKKGFLAVLISVSNSVGKSALFTATVGKVS